MASISHFLVLVLSCVALVHVAKQDDCVPGYVENLQLTGNATLSWETPSTEKCDIGFYTVQVTYANGTVVYTYTVTDKHVDLGHLESCQSYTFRVFQVSAENITGSGFAIFSVTPPPSEASLHLEYLNLTQDGKAVRLEWALEPEYVRCARHYRVVVYNADNNDAKDIYTSLTSVIVNNIVPCSHYTFGVRAIFVMEKEGPVTLIQHTAAADVTTRPKLNIVTPGRTTLSFIWSIEDYTDNRCPVYSLILDGSPNFNVTYEIEPDAPRMIFLTVDGLTPDNLYYLSAVTNNSAGYSAPFLMAVQTLPSS